MPIRDDFYESDKKEVGQKIKSVREDHGLSQDTLADFMDIQRNQISRHERGLNDMNIGTFFKYADALGISPQVLCPERFQPAAPTDKLIGIIPLLQQLDTADLDLIKHTAEHLLKKGSGVHQI